MNWSLNNFPLSVSQFKSVISKKNVVVSVGSKIAKNHFSPSPKSISRWANLAYWRQWRMGASRVLRCQSSLSQKVGKKCIFGGSSQKEEYGITWDARQEIFQMQSTSSSTILLFKEKWVFMHNQRCINLCVCVVFSISIF